MGDMADYYQERDEMLAEEGVKEIPRAVNQNNRDEEIDEILSWDIDGHKEPVIFAPELKQAILAYVNSKVIEARIDEVRRFERKLNTQKTRNEMWVYKQKRIAALNKQSKQEVDSV